jgi:hypothetical protein
VRSYVIAPYPLSEEKLNATALIYGMFAIVYLQGKALVGSLNLPSMRKLNIRRNPKTALVR